MEQKQGGMNLSVCRPFALSFDGHLDTCAELNVKLFMGVWKLEDTWEVMALQSQLTFGAGFLHVVGLKQPFWSALDSYACSRLYVFYVSSVCNM